jgi:hypothetical protein
MKIISRNVRYRIDRIVPEVRSEYSGQSVLQLFRTNSVRGPKCPVPPWSRTVGEPRYTARLFHFKRMDLHLTEFQ